MNPYRLARAVENDALAHMTGPSPREEGWDTGFAAAVVAVVEELRAMSDEWLPVATGVVGVFNAFSPTHHRRSDTLRHSGQLVSDLLRFWWVVCYPGAPRWTSAAPPVCQTVSRPSGVGPTLRAWAQLQRSRRGTL